MKTPAGAHSDWSAGTGLPHGESSYRRLHLREHPPAVRQEQLPFRQEPDAPRRAIEERSPELLFRAADLPAARRPRDMRSLRGAPDMPLDGDGNEVPELSEAHPKALPGCARRWKH